MREKLEAGILTVASQNTWVEQLIKHTHTHSDKVKLIKVELDSEAFATEATKDYKHGNISYPDTEILQRIRFLLDRFDVVLLPVSNNSLMWNRILLAHTKQQLNRPLLGLPIDTNPIAFIDLKELGLSDFVSDPMNTDELRVRLMASMEQARAISHKIEDPGTSNPLASMMPVPTVSYPVDTTSNAVANKPSRMNRRRMRLFDSQVTAHEAFNFNDAFKVAKANVVMQFERKYIIHALIQSNGNIGRAAKAADKHRRAFWELMRKHGIEADNYRDLLEG